MRALFVADLDGTLQDGPRGVPGRNWRAIERAVDRGVTVAVVTGRNLGSMGEIGPELAIRGVRLATSNGAVVLAADNRTPERVRPLGWGLVRRLVAWDRLSGLRLFCITTGPRPDAECLVRGAAGEWRLAESPYRLERSEPMPPGLLQLAQPVHVAVELPSRAEAEEVGAALESVLGGEASWLVVRSPIGPGALLEVLPTGGKGAALIYLARALSVPAAATAAIGDELNDVDMLELAGHAFAVGGSVLASRLPQVTAVAPVGEAAVADALERFLDRLDRSASVAVELGPTQVA